MCFTKLTSLAHLTRTHFFKLKSYATIAVNSVYKPTFIEIVLNYTVGVPPVIGLQKRSL